MAGEFGMSPEMRGPAFGAIHNTLTEHRHRTPTEQARAVLTALENRGITLQWAAVDQRTANRDQA